MSPEDGCLNVIESLDDDAVSTTAFTRRGLDHLDELLDQRRSDFIQERVRVYSRARTLTAALVQWVGHDAATGVASETPYGARKDIIVFVEQATDQLLVDVRDCLRIGEVAFDYR
eukprot:gene23516-24992_t